MPVIASAVVTDKADPLTYLHFDIERFTEGVRGINQKVSVFQVSCTQRNGIPEWVSWLLGEMARG